MVVVLFFLVVALILWIINLSAKNTELTIKISQIENKQNDIYGKAFYNYQQIKGINHKLGLTEEENRKIAETIRTPVVQITVNTSESVIKNKSAYTVPSQRQSSPVTAVNSAAHAPNATAANVNYQTASVHNAVGTAASTETTRIQKATYENIKQTRVASVRSAAPAPNTTAANENNQTAAVHNAAVTAASSETPRIQKEPAAPAQANLHNKMHDSVKPESMLNKKAADTESQVSAAPVNKAASYCSEKSVSAEKGSQRPVQDHRNINPYTGQPVQTEYRQYNPAVQPPVRPRQVKKSTGMSVESWLGTRLFNIVASVLIFIGLILFCMLGYEYITDGMKIAAMHVVSLSFVGIGGYLTKKNRSVFSLGLTGCGMGSFFISILLTHVYFDAINDVTAFSLLFVWIILALFLSKKLDSLMLSITAHIGMAVSVCFAFAMGFSADRIILPIIYQMASIAVIVIGNVICYKKTYRFGLFMSMGLLIYSSGIITYTLGKAGIVPNEVSTGLTIAVFTLQFIALSFVSYLIAVSCSNLESKGKYGTLPYVIQVINKMLWSAGVIETVGSLVYIICKSSYGITNLVYPSIAVCIVTGCHMLVTLFLSEKLNFSEKLAKISIYFISGFVTISLFIQATQRTTLHGMPLLFIYTGLVMLIRRYTRNKKLNNLISFLIAAEMLYVATYGYRHLANVGVSLLYMVMLGFMVLLHWFGQTEESRQRRFSFFKLAEFLWVCASVIPINISEFSNISLPLIISEFSLIGVIAYLTRYDDGDSFILKLIVKAEAFLTMFACWITLCGIGSGLLGDVFIIKIVYLIMTVSLFIVYCYEFATSNSTILQSVSSVLIAAYLSAFCIGYGDKLAIANIYRDVLHGMPFFFVTAVAAFVIYMLNKNTKLVLPIMIPLGIDMLYMIASGYRSLHNAREISSEFVTIDIGFIGILQFIAVSVMIYLLWHTQPKKEKSKTVVTILKIVFYYWAMFAVTVLTSALCLDLKAGAGYPLSFSIIFVIIINAAAIWFKFGKDRTLGHDNVRSSVFETVINITATVILYISIIFIGMRIKINTEGVNYAPMNYSIRFAQIITALGLFWLLTKEYLKHKNLLSELFVCFTATVFINAACRGIPVLSNIVYIYSIVTMIVALVCIIAGFVSKSKGMRMYGLILIMGCVLKLVTIDISSENSMSRVLAFVVGGIVCFMISGIYNIFEKKFSEKNVISENIE